MYRVEVTNDAGMVLGVLWLPRDPGALTTTVDYVPSDIGETVAEGRFIGQEE